MKIEYTVPKRYKGDFRKFDPAAFGESIKAAERSNMELYRQRREAHEQLCKDTIALYGRNSNEARYIRKARPASPPDLLRKVLRPTLKQYEAFKQRAEARQEYRRYIERRKQANKRLQEAEYIARTDYKKSQAISFAKRQGINVTQPMEG